MHDRFKFRAYNTYTGEFIKNIYNIGDYAYMEDDDGKNFRFMKVEGTKTTIYSAQPKKDWVIMQCTGLKDKNSTLIYEGDILKQSDGCIGYVVWQGVSYWIESPGSHARDLECVPYYETVEIIGNIYENKELLDNAD